jgi:hypothetical protein
MSIAHLYTSRPFQQAIVELCRRQGLKVIEDTDGRTTDGRQSDIQIGFFFQNRTKNEHKLINQDYKIVPSHVILTDYKKNSDRLIQNVDIFNTIFLKTQFN